MLDPDAPTASKPAKADWIHLGVSNVKGSDLVSGAFHPTSINGDIFVGEFIYL